MNQKEFANILDWARYSASAFVQSVYQIYNQSDFEAFHPLLLSRDITSELVGAVKLTYSDEPNFHLGPPPIPPFPRAVPQIVSSQVVSAKTRRLSARWTFERMDDLGAKIDIEEEIMDALVKEIDEETIWSVWLRETNWNGDAD